MNIMYRDSSFLKINEHDIRNRITYYQDNIFDNIYFVGNNKAYKGFLNYEIEKEHYCLNTHNYVKKETNIEDVKYLFYSNPALFRIPVIHDNILIGEYYNANTLGQSLYKKIEDRSLQIFHLFADELKIWANNKNISIICNQQVFRKFRKFIPEIKLYNENDNYNDSSIIIDTVTTDHFRKYFNLGPRSAISLSKVLMPIMIEKISSYFRINNIAFYIVNGIKKSHLSNPNKKELDNLKKTLEEVINDEDYVKLIYKNDLNSYNHIQRHKQDINQISRIIFNGIHNILLDRRDIDFNIINGQRITIGNPIVAKQKIHFYGPCVIQGLCVSDSQTIPSIVQKNINSLHYKNIQVENHGLAYGKDLINDLLYIMSTNFSKNDIVILMSGFTNEEIEVINRNKITIIDGIKCLRNKQNWFLNSPFHCNTYANKILADIIFKQIRSNLQDNMQKEYIGNIIKNQNMNLRYDSFSIVDTFEMKQYLSTISKYKIKNRDNLKIGSIVMNANPCTYGHIYLIDEALKMVDYLYIFLVEESKNSYDYIDREYMLKSNFKDNNRVCIISGGSILTSEISFPEYFNRNIEYEHIDPTLNIRIFAEMIAPLLNIKYRFFGNEPNDNVTSILNKYAIDEFPKYGIEVHIIQRKEINGIPVSAKTVRSMLKLKNYNQIYNLVPFPTFYRLLELNGETLDSINKILINLYDGNSCI